MEDHEFKEHIEESPKKLVMCKDNKIRTFEECTESEVCYPKPIAKAIFPKPRNKTKRDKPRFGMTTLVNECVRQAYYEMTEDQVIPYDKFWIFSRGHAIHEFIDFERKEVWIEKPFAVFDAIGFIDGIDENYLYELKTTANIPETPQQHHVLQVQGYFSMMSPEEQANIKEIRIVYISMDKIKMFVIPKRDISPFLEAKGTMLAQALKEKKLPVANSSWQCNYCTFKHMCDASPMFNQGQQSLKNF